MEEIGDIDFSAIEDVMQNILGGSGGFEGYVDMVMEGQDNLSYQNLFAKVINNIAGEMFDLKTLLTEMIIIILLASVFVNFSKTFKSKQVSETGF